MVHCYVLRSWIVQFCTVFYCIVILCHLLDWIVLDFIVLYCIVLLHHFTLSFNLNVCFKFQPCSPHFLHERVVISTGLPADVSYFMGCGVDKVLLKPLDLDLFLHTMTIYKNESKNEQIKEMGKEIERERGRSIGRG